MARGGFLQRIYTAGLTLALFALTFKALLPPGFMLDAGAGRVAIMLCNAGEAYFDTRTGQISHGGDEQPAADTSQHCPFALGGAGALAPPEVALQPAPVFVFLLSAAPAREAIGEHDATGPPLPARGPPTQA